MSKKLLVGLSVGVIVFAGGAFLLLGGKANLKRSEVNMGQVTSSDFIYYSSDVIGTHVGTSTVGKDFESNVTSTFISKIGGNKQWANYTFKVTAASTTANLAVKIEGSNDWSCDTAITSTADEVWTTNINWFDASDHLSNIASTANMGPVYMIWTNPSSTLDSGDEILLTNLNYECLRLSVSGNSTTIYAGLRTK